jgi:hypothetical protein
MEKEETHSQRSFLGINKRVSQFWMHRDRKRFSLPDEQRNP